MSDKVSYVRFVDKSSQAQLSPYIPHDVFKCKCSHPDCIYTLVADNTLKSFELTREQFLGTLYVTSAFRCQRHNKAAGGLVTSFHLKGLAMDLQPKEKSELGLLEMYARLYFDVVVRYPTFIHCHNKEHFHE